MKIFKGAKSELTTTLKEMLAAPMFGVDTETTGLSAHSDKIRLMQISTPHDVVVIDTFQYDREWIFKVIKRWFDATGNKPKIFANAKFDLQFFKSEGIDNINEVHDVLMMFRVKYNGECSKFPNLVEVINFCFDKSLSIADKKEKQKEDWGIELTDDQYEYAGNDTLYLPALYTHLKQELQDEGVLWNVYKNIEMACLPSVVDMEYNGVPVDTDVFDRIRYDLTPKRDLVVSEIVSYFQEIGDGIAGEIWQGLQSLSKLDVVRVICRVKAAGHFPDKDKHQLNLNSWQQIIPAFKTIGVFIPNTTEETLEQCDHEMASKMLEYRGYKKLLEFVNNLPTFVNENTLRLHGGFHQLGTDTGRFTASKPNLQQVPRPISGQEIVLRSFVKASEGYTLVCADYSQLELVIAAEITQDPLMLETYNSGGDIHKLTASLILGKPIEEVTKGDRQLAKAVNFGLIYGMGAAKLVLYAKNSYRVTMTLEEATSHRNNFFNSYVGLRDWHNRANNEIRAGATTSVTLAGRVRKFSRVKGAQNELRFTSYLNTQDQGTGGDIIKIAMAVLHRTLPQARLILQVHDELVYEVPIDQAEYCRAKVENTMVQAGKVLIRSVPVAVEAKIGKTWDEAK